MVCQNARVFFLYRIIFIVLSTSPVMYLFPKDPAQISDDSVNTLVKETMMGQSLMAEQERIRRFQRPPLRVRLLSDHQDLLYMMSVLTQYFSQYSSAVPVRLAAAWSELLTHSIGDAGLVRGGQNSLVTAINEVVVSLLMQLRRWQKRCARAWRFLPSSAPTLGLQKRVQRTA